MKLGFLAFLVIGTVLIIRQQQAMPYQHDEGMVFGTVYHIAYQSDKNYKADIERELQKVDNALSMFNQESVISRINRNEDVVVDKMFKEWYDSNVKWSYYDSAYPWTRLGYTYDWADNGTEYGLSEFIVFSGAEADVEYTFSVNDFIAFVTEG